MRHIHTSIVSRHLATRGNNKILRTPPPHTSSSEERLPRLTRRTLAQLRTNKSPFLKSYLHKVDAKIHPSPLCPLGNIHTHDTHHLFNCTHIRTTLSPLNLWTDPAGVTALLARWTEKLAGGPQAGTLDSPHQQGSWEFVANNKTQQLLTITCDMESTTNMTNKEMEMIQGKIYNVPPSVSVLIFRRTLLGYYAEMRQSPYWGLLIELGMKQYNI